MSYTFAATGLPPGLTLVGSEILGTPSTPGNYTVTVTVSDGVSSVSETVNVSIDPVVVPLPFWQLILSAESGCYASESLALRFLATADTGSYWQDDAGIKPAPPIVAVESGSYWRDLARAATAESGSYARDSATARPLIRVDSGSYWRDSAAIRPIVTVESGSYWLDSVTAGGGSPGYAEQWRSNAIAGGGTISTATYNATVAFVNTLTASGTLDKINLLWHFSGDFAASKYLLKYPTGHPGSVTYSGFSAGQYAETTGLTSTGSEYADLSYIPLTYQASVDAGSLIAYVHSGTAGQVPVGVFDTANNGFDIFHRNASNNQLFDCYDDTAGGRLTVTNTVFDGLYIGNRNASNYMELSRNGTVLGTNTLSRSGARPNRTLIAFGLNYQYQQNTTFLSAQRLSLIAAGEGLNSTDVATINSAYATFAAAIGRSLP